MLQSAKSTRHMSVQSDTEGHDSDVELSPRSTEDAGNNGYSPTASKVQQLQFSADTIKRLTGVQEDAVKEIGNDEKVKYVQEEDDSDPFEFTKDEVLFSLFAMSSMLHCCIASSHRQHLFDWSNAWESTHWKIDWIMGRHCGQLSDLYWLDHISYIEPDHVSMIRVWYAVVPQVQCIAWQPQSRWSSKWLVLSLVVPFTRTRNIKIERFIMISWWNTIYIARYVRFESLIADDSSIDCSENDYISLLSRYRNYIALICFKIIQMYFLLFQTGYKRMFKKRKWRRGKWISNWSGREENARTSSVGFDQKTT